MVITDTSFLYAFFNKADFHHKDALSLNKKFEDEVLFAPIEVIEELLTSITRKVSSDSAVRVVKDIFDNEAVTILSSNDFVFDKGWETFKKLSPHKFSFVDCMLISIAKESEATVLTFDKEIQKALR